MGKFLRDKEKSIALHRRLVALFRYNPYLDFIAGIELSNLIKKNSWDLLPHLNAATVIGPVDPPGDVDGFVIVADSALNYYSGNCSMVVTDLDGPVEKIVEGKFIKVVHAHGDNIDKLAQFVPRMKGLVLGTTQSVPVGAIRNIGGFTDGDRSVIMALLMGAKEVNVFGFDFNEPLDEPKHLKQMKMEVSKRILSDISDAEITFKK
ncbi:MAG: hypothetical protein QXN66_01435 [Thermoplasmatales archaeon]